MSETLYEEEDEEFPDEEMEEEEFLDVEMEEE